MTNKINVKKYENPAKRMFLGSELDRMFDEMLDSTAFPFGLMTAFAPALPRGKAVQEGFIQPRMNITGDEKAWHISVEIPGVEEKDIVVEMKENSLIISGEKKQEKEEKNEEKGVYHVERSFGSFRRVVTMPEDVKADEITASYKQGVLDISLPRREQVKEEPRKIEITHG